MSQGGISVGQEEGLSKVAFRAAIACLRTIIAAQQAIVSVGDGGVLRSRFVSACVCLASCPFGKEQQSFQIDISMHTRRCKQPGLTGGGE